MAKKALERMSPPLWTDDEFASDAAVSLSHFRDERLTEPLEKYGDEYEQKRDLIETLLEQTVDLTDLHSQACELLSSAENLEVLRYIASPPVSADDLQALTGVPSLAASRLAKDLAGAETIIDTILQVTDSRRFPWLREDRQATQSEREVAIVSTAALIAAQRVQTDRRNEGGKALENLVATRLLAAGFTKVEPRTINTFNDAPKAGEFCHESEFATRKADLVVGLYDGRVMPIECKVSNSSTNSVKRLNNDAAKKAVTWNKRFGTDNLVASAVITGVFKVHNLRDAQDEGLTVWWGHNLDALVAFVLSTKTPPAD